MALRQSNDITDRAKRYRAQSRVTGPRRCVICGGRQNLGVMHLSGNESDGEPANLAYGCKSCNGKLGAAFKSIGAGRPTNQYNPASGHVPTFEQYKWAVTHHTRGEHDEGGKVIHATPKHKRIEYAKRIAAFAAPARRAASAQRRQDFEDRWNPGEVDSYGDPIPKGYVKVLGRVVKVGSKAHKLLLEKKRHADDLGRQNPTGEVGPYAVVVSDSFGETVIRRFKTEAAAERFAENKNRVRTGLHSRAIYPSVHKVVKSNPWPFSSAGRSARDTTPASGGIAKFSKGRKASAPESKKKSAAPAAAFSRVPDEKTIQEGFKRGLSLADILRENPCKRNSSESVQEKSWREWRENFERVSRDPERATAKDLRRALGYLDKARASMIRRAHDKGLSPDRNVLAGFDNEFEYLKSLMLQRERGNPPSEHIADDIDIMRDAYQAKKELIRSVGISEKEANSIAASSLKDQYRIAVEYRGIPKGKLSVWVKGWKHYGRRNPAPEIGGRDFRGGYRLDEQVESINRQMERASITSKKWRELNKRKDALLKRVSDEWRIKGNPAGAAAEVFEEFHGFEPSEVITVTKKVFHHEHLASAGKLTHLEIAGIDGNVHKVTGFRGSILAFNESKNQLFVEGGDQSINLGDFGIKKPHELETLGQLTDIGYATNKTHLGDEGGEAVYVHKLRTTNDNGRHVIVKVARYPDVIYDVRNEQLLFSGGSYEILREGINK